MADIESQKLRREHRHKKHHIDDDFNGEDPFNSYDLGDTLNNLSGNSDKINTNQLMSGDEECILSNVSGSSNTSNSDDSKDDYDYDEDNSKSSKLSDNKSESDS